MEINKKLAVVFPGIGYHCDKPLLYYARKTAATLDYEIRLVPYSLKGGKSPEDLLLSYKEALSQSGEILSDLDFSSYDKIVFISKSIGSAVAASFANEKNLSASHLIYTPVPLTFEKLNPEDKALVFHGTKDPLCDNSLCVAERKLRKKMELELVKGGNHSLETGFPLKDMKTLFKVMKKSATFIEG